MHRHYTNTTHAHHFKPVQFVIMMEVSFSTVSEGDSLPMAGVIDNALDVGVAAAQSSDHVLVVDVSIEVSCGTMIHNYSLCMYECM